jgi:hypothetical protein
MSTCTEIKKSDKKPCTNPAKYGDKCGVHRDKLIYKTTSKIQVKTTSKTQVKTTSKTYLFPKAVGENIGSYIDVTEFDLNDSNLSEFKYLVENFQGTIVPSNFPKFLDKICETNSIESVKYLKKAFSKSPCLNDAKYIKRNTIFFKLVTHNYTDLFKLIVDIYNPDLIEHVFKICYNVIALLYENKNYVSDLNPGRIGYNIFEKCSKDMLMCLFSKIKENNQLKSFRKFFSHPHDDNSGINTMYVSLLKRGDSELIFFIHNIVHNYINANYYLNRKLQIDLVPCYISALKVDDLKLADFISKGPFYMEKISGYENMWNLNIVLCELCRNGKLSTLKYLGNLDDFNLYELISNACIKGHLKVVKYLFKLIPEDYPLYDLHTMCIVYAKTIQKRNYETAQWLANKFNIDTNIDLEYYEDGNEEWEHKWDPILVEEKGRYH